MHQSDFAVASSRFPHVFVYHLEHPPSWIYIETLTIPHCSPVAGRPKRRCDALLSTGLLGLGQWRKIDPTQHQKMIPRLATEVMCKFLSVIWYDMMWYNSGRITTTTAMITTEINEKSGIVEPKQRPLRLWLGETSTLHEPLGWIKGVTLGWRSATLSFFEQFPKQVAGPLNWGSLISVAGNFYACRAGKRLHKVYLPKSAIHSDMVYRHVSLTQENTL